MVSAPAPGDHFRVLNSTLGRLENFAWKSYAGYPGFDRYGALGTLEFFSEHSLKQRAFENQVVKVQSTCTVCLLCKKKKGLGQY